MNYFRKELADFIPYTPGEQPPADAAVIKLNTNENPYPPSPAIKAAIKKILDGGFLRRYPNFYSRALQEELAQKHNLEPENFIVTNGSDEGLRLLFTSVLGPGDKMVLPWPTYSHYPVLVNMTMTGSEVVKIPVKDDLGFDIEKLKKTSGKLLAFAHPNAPTALMEKKEDLEELVKSFSGIVLSDEAYIDFAGEKNSMIDNIGKYPNLVVARTFSKSYSLAGIRTGYLAASREIISVLNKLKDSYNMNMLSQYVALAALKDRDYFERHLKLVIDQREFVTTQLRKLGFTLGDSKTNFLFAMPPKGISAEDVYQKLKSQNIYIRYFSGELVSKYVRITIGTEEENRLMLTALKSLAK